MDEFTAHILRVLVEGHQARLGMKDRNRALTEYEIARRAGYTEYSYVQFSTTPERDQVRGALDELERGGWVTQWDRAGRYDSFVPTELGVRRVHTQPIVQNGPDPPLAPPSEAVAAPPGSRVGLVPGAASSPPEATLARLVEQLDEVLTLLRAIDAKLGRDH